MSKTPRTDAVAYRVPVTASGVVIGTDEVVRASFARELEQETREHREIEADLVLDRDSWKREAEQASAIVVTATELVRLQYMEAEAAVAEFASISKWHEAVSATWRKLRELIPG